MKPDLKTWLVVAGALAFAACSPKIITQRALQRADQYAAAGELDKARVEYLTVLRADPQNIPALRGLGFAWFDQGAPVQAIPFLLRVKELAPEDVAARLKLGITFATLADNGNARKELLAVLDRSPNDPDALLLLAESVATAADVAEARSRLTQARPASAAVLPVADAILSMRQSRFDDAEVKLAEAVRLDPKFPPAWVSKANLDVIRKQPDQARKDFTRAAELSPPRSTARLKYAKFLLNSGDIPEARKTLQQITHEAPDFLPALLLSAQLESTEKNFATAAKLLADVFGRDYANYDGRLLEAKITLLQGKPEKAIELLKHLNTTYPNAPTGPYELARAYLLNASPSQARTALNEAIRLNPRFTEALLLLGQLDLRDGDSQAAILSMQKLLATFPDYFPAQMLLAEAYRNVGRFADAEKILRRGIEVSPASVEPRIFLGIVLRQLNRDAEARASFEKAREMAPGNLLALSQLTEMDIAAGDLAPALRRTQEFLAASPQSAGGYLLEGQIFAAQKNGQKAEEALLRAVGIEPDFALAYNVLVSNYVATGQLAAARDKTESYLTRNPENISARITSAMIYERLEDFPRAAEAYEKVLAANPDSIAALNNLACLYADKLNKLDRAYELASRARALKPDEPAVADTLGWILYQRGDYRTALQLLRESAGKLPEKPNIQYHVGLAAYMMGQTENSRKALELAVASPVDFPGKEDAKGHLALLAKSSGNSLESIEQNIQLRPNDPALYVQLGQARLSAGHKDDAITAFEKALAINPALTATAVDLARLYLASNRSDKALTLLQSARTTAPGDPGVTRALADVAFGTANYPWAYSLYGETLVSAPADVEVLSQSAWTAYYLGRVNEARERMQKILTLNPPAALALEANQFLTFTSAADGENLHRLREMAQDVLRTKPEYLPALMMKASGQPGDSAAALYESALARFPDFAPAQKQLAGIYASLPGKTNQAYDLASKARATLPDDAELTKLLGKLSFQQGNYRAAQQLLSDASTMSALDAENLYYLGMAYWKLNRKAESDATLRRSIKAGLPNPLSTEAERVIALLQQH